MCDGSAAGVTTISWTASGTGNIEVWVRLTVILLASGGGSVSWATGKWVRDGSVFYLQDVSEGRPLISTNTLATVRVTVTISGCP